MLGGPAAWTRPCDCVMEQARTQGSLLPSPPALAFTQHSLPFLTSRKFVRTMGLIFFLLLIIKMGSLWALKGKRKEEKLY